MRIYDRIKNMTLEEMAIHYAKLNEALYIGIKNKLKAQNINIQDYNEGNAVELITSWLELESEDETTNN